MHKISNLPSPRKKHLGLFLQCNKLFNLILVMYTFKVKPLISIFHSLNAFVYRATKIMIIILKQTTK